MTGGRKTDGEGGYSTLGPYVPALVLVVAFIGVAAVVFGFRTDVGPIAYGLVILALAAVILINQRSAASGDLGHLAIAGLAAVAIVLSGADPNPVWFLGGPTLVLAIMRPAERRDQARLMTRVLVVAAAAIVIGLLIWAAVVGIGLSAMSDA